MARISISSSYLPTLPSMSLLTCSVLLIAVLLCWISVLRCHDKVADDIQEAEGHRPSNCNYQSHPISESCSTNMFKACSCPSSYQLFTNFTTAISNCKQSCFLPGKQGPDNLLCRFQNQVIQCTGASFAAPQCQFATNILSSICSNCGEMMTFGDRIYCVLWNSNLQLEYNFNPCQAGYQPTCMNITRAGCVDLTDDDVQFLTNIKCDTPSTNYQYY